MKRIAFYGGSFDPPHLGHLKIAERLTGVFGLEQFVLIPAFHAPHKKRKKPTSVFHRFAMLCLATNRADRVSVSLMEIETPERPYSIQTLSRLRRQLPDAEIFFVIGADSWAEITTWRDWESVLTIVNIIVVTRPGYEIGFAHITPEIRDRIVDLRGEPEKAGIRNPESGTRTSIFITDAVKMDISATEIRRKISAGEGGWRELLPDDVAKYIEKYDIYNQ